jgi:hypothetical protein
MYYVAITHPIIASLDHPLFRKRERGIEILTTLFPPKAKRESPSGA